MRSSVVLFTLLAVPLAEIAVFVLIGGQIGVLATLGLTLATAVAGTILLRIQGFGVMDRIRQTLEAHEIPGRELVHGVMIMAAGLLLLTPGFVTDTLGFLLFVPAIREAGWRFLRRRVITVEMGAAQPGQEPRRGPTIDLGEEDYTDIGDDPGSPWKRGGGRGGPPGRPNLS